MKAKLTKYNMKPAMRNRALAEHISSAKPGHGAHGKVSFIIMCRLDLKVSYT